MPEIDATLARTHLSRPNELRLFLNKETFPDPSSGRYQMDFVPRGQFLIGMNYWGPVSFISVAKRCFWSTQKRTRNQISTPRSTCHFLTKPICCLHLTIKTKKKSTLKTRVVLCLPLDRQYFEISKWKCLVLSKKLEWKLPPPEPSKQS